MLPLRDKTKECPNGTMGDWVKKYLMLTLSGVMKLPVTHLMRNTGAVNLSASG